MQRIHESSYHPDRYVERVKYFGELEVAQVVTATQRDTLLTNPYQSRLRHREVYTTIQQRQRDHIKSFIIYHYMQNKDIIQETAPSTITIHKNFLLYTTQCKDSDLQQQGSS